MAAIGARMERSVWTEGSPAPGLPQPPALPRKGKRPDAHALQEMRRLRRGLGAIAVSGALLAAVAGGSAVISMQSFALQGETAAVSTLRGQNRTLSVRLAEMQNPERIQRIATDQLGLHRPSGYVPVPTASVPPAPTPQPGRTTNEVVSVPAGPAPGGAVDLWQRGAGWVQQHLRPGSGSNPG